MALKDMFQAVNNSVPTRLAEAITATATTLLLEDGAVLPDAPNVVTLSVEDTAELVWYGAKADGTLSSCVRGYGGTAAQMWPEHTPAYRAYTAVDHQGFIDNIQTLDTAKLERDGEAAFVHVAFETAEARANVESGERLSTLFGKLRRWFSSFGAAAWMNTGTAAGTVAAGNHSHTATAVGALVKPAAATNGNLAMFGADREAVDSGKAAANVYSREQILAFVRDALYPVGCIYLSTTSQSPAALLGGSWVRIAQGRTLVGLQEGDADFGAARKAGGDKAVALTEAQMPAHAHDFRYSTDAGETWAVNPTFGRSPGPYGELDAYMGVAKGIEPYASFQMAINNAGGSLAHSNLQPYYTVYIWERTA